MFPKGNENNQITKENIFSSRTNTLSSNQSSIFDPLRSDNSKSLVSRKNNEEEEESIKINYSVVGPDNKSIKKKKLNGPGEIIGAAPKGTKDQMEKQLMDKEYIIYLQKDLLAKTNMSDYQVEQYLQMQKNIPNNRVFKALYNNNVHKKKFKCLLEFESYIKNLPPMLDWYAAHNIPVTNANFKSKFLSVSIHHVQGTMIMIQNLFPHLKVRMDVVYDSMGVDIVGINLTLVNGLFPIVSEKFYGAPGKKCNGNPKGDLTYAAKFSDTFNFLKTYKFDTYSGNVTNSVNLMNVMNEFKADFFEVSKPYANFFRYCLDTIAHFYLERSVLPPSSEFTIDKLRELFPKEKVYSKCFFYTVSELQNDPDLIEDDDDDDNEIFASFSKLNKYTSDDVTLTIEGEKALSKNVGKDGSNSGGINTEGLKENSDSIDVNHLIPRDYETCSRRIHSLMVLYVKNNLLPAGVHVHSEETGSGIKQTANGHPNKLEIEDDGPADF